MGQYRVISGDGHIDLNPDVWRNRVAAKWRERAPKRVKMPNGSDAVVVDGGKPNTIGVTRSVRVAHQDMGKQVPTFENSAGTGTPEQRVREQDQDGVDCEVLFSQISLVLRQAKDDDFYCELVRAYNEFLGEGMAAAPNRLICMGTIPVTGVDDAIKELEHCARLGFKGVRLDAIRAGKVIQPPRTTSFGPLRSISKCRLPIIVTAIWDQAGGSRTFFILRSQVLTSIRRMRLGSSLVSPIPA